MKQYMNDVTGKIFTYEELEKLYEQFGYDTDFETLEDFIDTLKELPILWYAVLMDEDDSDWGYGSYDLCEAKRMCLEMENPDAHIAVIDVTDNDPLCIKMIYQDEF